MSLSQARQTGLTRWTRRCGGRAASTVSWCSLCRACRRARPSWTSTRAPGRSRPPRTSSTASPSSASATAAPISRCARLNHCLPCYMGCIGLRDIRQTVKGMRAPGRGRAASTFIKHYGLVMTSPTGLGSKQITLHTTACQCPQCLQKHQITEVLKALAQVQR